MTKPLDGLNSLDQQLKDKANQLKANVDRMKFAVNHSGKGSDSVQFPLEVFPLKLKEMVNAYCSTFGADPGHYGLCILTVAGAVVGNRAWIADRGHTHPPLLYGGMVGDPGAGKTPISRTILYPLVKIEKQMREEHSKALREWKKKAQEAGKDTEAPPPPQGKELILYDFTLESFYKVLRASPNGVIVPRDELYGWLTSMNQYKKSGGEEQFWLENYNGAMVKINRQKTDRPMMIDHSFCAVIGGTQPKLIEKFIEGDKAYNGFLARILWAYPDAAKKQVYNDKKVDIGWRDYWSKMINSLHTLPTQQQAPIDEFDEWKLDPIILPLSDGAQGHYQQFFNSIVADVNNSDDEVEKAVLTKFDGHVLRLSLILHFLHWADKVTDSWIDELGITIDELASMEISGESMQGAISMAKYFRYTSLKVTGRIASPINSLPEAQKLWYNNLPEEFERSHAVELGDIAKISSRTVSRLLQNPTLFKRQRQGVYWKNHLN